MLGFLAHVHRRLKYRWVRNRKLQLVRLCEEGVPLDRTWKLCEQIINGMKLDDLALIPIPMIQLYTVRTPYRSIETYQKTVDYIRHALKEENKLDRGWSSFEMQIVTVGDFLISEQGFYLTSNALPKFLLSVKEVLELIEQADGEELGVTGFNHRALIPFFVRLRDTLLDLYDLQFASK
jgi:hypothetical protein